ncbi:cathepsin G [Echinops telfairi]|uniref:Cathepsin G n=1 Tax=Echinops telfairi TaxID=9371 RepID=A0ABM0IEY7_ECHTE|nr:cathepsin G [Echinops telfairi]
MQLLFLLSALFLPAGAGAGEIIGGREARPHSHPYMAFLQIRSQNGASTCGGFLVREDFVLTAAHCSGSTINVILGAHNIKRPERTQQRIPARRVILHPNYNPQTQLNDIMLLKLGNRTRQNRFVRPVALPRSQTRLQPGTVCTAAGWGLVSLNQRTSILQDVQLRIQRDQECHNRFRQYRSLLQICVGSPEERKSVFLGDSGGPLVCNNVAQGIVSYGKLNGIPPAVFTKIGNFLPWIRSTMRRFKQEG